MDESITAGAVSLDLVIKDTLDKQLDGIKSRIESALSKVSETSANKAAAATDNAAKAAEASVKKAENSIGNMDFSKITKSVSEVASSMKQVSSDVKRMAAFGYSYLDGIYQYLEKITGVKARIEPIKVVEPEAVKNTEKVAEETEEVVGNTEQASKSTEKLTQKTSKLAAAASYVGRISKRAFGAGFKLPLWAGGKAIDGVRSKLKSVASSISETTKPASRLFNTLKNSARRIFLVAGIAAAFKGLKSALGEAASSNQEFADSLESIKFNLAVAFQPITTAVMPMLNTLMSGIANVTQKIAAFTSALFGKTYQQSAKAVAKSKQAAAAAKKAGKEAKTASKYLADFDEMRVHQDSSDSSSGGGSDETDYSKLADQDVKLSSGLEKLKNAIKSGDLGSIGKMIADKINSSVLGIKWDKLREKVRKGAGKLADGINGFTANLKWKKLGESIGNGITTAFTFAYTFLKSTKWKEIGTGFGNLLNGIVEKTDFGLVGKTLGAKFNALIGLVFGFVSTFDFAKAGLGLSDLVNGWLGEVNWEQLGDSLGLSIQGMIDFAFNFITNLNFKDAASNLSTVLNRTIEKIDFEKLGQTVSDLFVGVWDFIGTALDEIDWENVGKSIGDFISGIKWGEILTSIFKAIGGVLKAMPSLLKGLVESLDFEGAAGLVGVLFAPKIASSLLSKFKSDPNVTSTLGESATTLANKIASGADLSSYSFTEKFAAATTAFFVGWKIGSWLYDTFQEQFDWWGEQLGKVFAKGITEEANKAVERANKAVKETNSAAKKYEKKGYKIDWTNESTIRDSVDKARIAESKKQKSAGWGTSPDSGGGGSTGKQTGSSGFDASQYMPKLASGGVVKAPTLALVGDNSDVKANPEVVAPLSELQKLTGTQDMVKYLQQIIMLLETMQFAFECEIDGDKLLKAVAKQNRKHKQRTGVSAI